MDAVRPLVDDQALGEVYDQVGRIYGRRSRWRTASSQRQAIATLARDLLRTHVRLVDLDGLTPVALAAATVDAAVRLNFASTAWDDVEGIAEEQHLAFAAALIDRARAEIEARAG